MNQKEIDEMKNTLLKAKNSQQEYIWSFIDSTALRVRKMLNKILN